MQLLPSDQRYRETYDSFGVCISIAAPDAERLEVLRTMMPPGSHLVWDRQPLRSYVLIDAEPEETGEPRHGLRIDDAEPNFSTDLVGLVDLVERDSHLTVAENARSWIFLHAGVVEWRGGGIVIPGNSMSGKSTLVTSLVRAGACYLSDEFAVVDQEGNVFPFSRPLRIRRPGGEDRVSVTELGGRAASGPVPVRLVLLTEYRPGHVWQPVALSPGRATLELMKHSARGAGPAAMVAAVSTLASSCPVLLGARGSVEETVPHILSLMEDMGTEE